MRNTDVVARIEKRQAQKPADADREKKDTPAHAGDTPREHVYRFELISPMLGGGARARDGTTGGSFDPHHPIRATGIRAQLRFWWRAFKRRHELEPLRKAEFDLFGGVLGNEPVDSKVHIRVVVHSRRHAPINLRMGADPIEKPGDIRQYVGHAHKGATMLTAAQFDLVVTCTSEELRRIKPALVAFANFGGVGARTRRGFGAVYCEKLALSKRRALAFVGAPQAVRQWPTLAARIESFDMSLHHMHLLFWAFRQGPGVARPNRAGRRPGPSYWPEAASVQAFVKATSNAVLADYQTCYKAKTCLFPSDCGYRNNPGICKDGKAIASPTRHYQGRLRSGEPAALEAPRAAFGLPLIVELKDEAVHKSAPSPKLRSPKAVKHTIDSRLGNRWASPLVLRPIRYRGEPPSAPAHMLSILLHSTFPGIKGRDWSTGTASVTGLVARYLEAAAIPGDPVHAFLDFARDYETRNP